MFISLPWRIPGQHITDEVITWARLKNGEYTKIERRWRVLYQETASTPAPAAAAMARCFSMTKGSRELNSMLELPFLLKSADNQSLFGSTFLPICSNGGIEICADIRRRHVSSGWVNVVVILVPRRNIFMVPVPPSSFNDKCIEDQKLAAIVDKINAYS